MNILSNASHQRALAAAQKYHLGERELIVALQEVEAGKVFLLLGYSSLFDYCVKELKLSESIACALIGVARKVKEVPVLASVLGEVSVSKLQRITPVLNRENAKEWIAKAKTLSKHALEREIARVKPDVLTPERWKFVTSTRLHLELGVSEELMDQLVRVKDLLSQRERRNVTLEEAIGELSQEYLQRHDPVVKAERLLKKEAKKVSCPGTVNQEVPEVQIQEPSNSEPKHKNPLVRQALKQLVRHEVMNRDRGRCTYVHGNGRRCKERRYLELHHRKPVSRGGLDTAENLMTLCYRHHRYLHVHALPDRTAMEVQRDLPAL